MFTKSGCISVLNEELAGDRIWHFQSWNPIVKTTWGVLNEVVLACPYPLYWSKVVVGHFWERQTFGFYTATSIASADKQTLDLIFDYTHIWILFLPQKLLFILQDTSLKRYINKSINKNSSQHLAINEMLLHQDVPYYLVSILLRLQLA